MSKEQEIKVTKKDIGRLVIYNPGYKTEEGVITSFNDTYVFVRYGSEVQSKATYYRDLKYSL